MVVCVGHIEIATTVHSQKMRVVESRGGAETVGGAIDARRAADGCYHSPSTHLANGMVAWFANKDVAASIYCHAYGMVKPCRDSCAIGATSHPRATGQRRHDPGSGDLADGVVV